MDQPFVIPDTEQCKRWLPVSCQARVTFDYINRKYTVEFPLYPFIIYGYDNIRITSTPQFLYAILYVCTTGGDDCAVKLVKNKIAGMVTRNYKVFDIINELSSILVERSSSTSTNDPLNCYYDTYNTIGNSGLCLLNDTGKRGQCQIGYNQRPRVVRYHKCDRSGDNTIVVDVSDSQSKYASLDIACNKTLCNSKTAVEQVIQILAKYSVTDTSGGTGRGGTTKMVNSQFLVLFALLLSLKGLKLYAN
jgi:hypothetical protein